MIPHKNVYDFLLAGKCEVTFHNTSTGNQCKAFITGYPSRKNSNNLLPFTGWTVRNAGYRKLGYIRGDVFIPEGEITEGTRRFMWIWRHVVAETIPQEIEVMHHGKCSYCNRPLTDAESIKTGLGPVCRGRLQSATHIAKPAKSSTESVAELPTTPVIETIPAAEEYNWEGFYNS